MGISPNAIKTSRAGGNDDMGDVTDRSSPARFTYDADRWVVVFVRAHSERIQNSSGGTDYANLVMKRDAAGATADYNQTLKTVVNFGPDDIASVSLRVEAGELPTWVFDRGDELVFEWTNPDSGDIAWSLEVGMADANAVTP